MHAPRRKNFNSVNAASLARWIVITGFLALIGLMYVYLTLQLYHQGDQKKALENELTSLRSQNDVAGVQIASSVANLHSDANNLTSETALTEQGNMIGPTRHDMLTGSNADGTLATGGGDTTCRGWTSMNDGRAMLGHSNRYGGGRGESWNAAHLSRGCSQDALRASLGDALFYCFAAD
jgi:hypothetical protein